MVLLIALVPALVVFAFVVASPKKSTLFWAPFWGLVVGMLGGPSFFLMDAGAVLLATFLGWLLRDKADPSGSGYVDEKWVYPGPELGSPASTGSTHAERKKQRGDASVQAAIDQENSRSDFRARAALQMAKRQALLAGKPLSETKNKSNKSSGA